MLPGLTALVPALRWLVGAVTNHKFICSARFGPYFVSPVIAGLEKDGTPYLAGTDSIGAIETAKDFMLAGTAPESLYGMCESMWRPDMVRYLFAPAKLGRFYFASHQGCGTGDLRPCGGLTWCASRRESCVAASESSVCEFVCVNAGSSRSTCGDGMPTASCPFTCRLAEPRVLGAICQRTCNVSA